MGTSSATKRVSLSKLLLQASLRSLGKTTDKPTEMRFKFPLIFRMIFTGLIGLSPSVSMADEFFAFCDPEAGLLSHQFSPQHLEAISNAAQEAEVAPFATACQDPESLRDRPKTGLFHRSIPSTDKRGRSSKELLNLVGEAALSDLEGEDGFLKAVEDCLTKPLETKLCPQNISKIINDWKAAFLKEVAGARIDLALAQDAKDYGTILSHSAQQNLNLELNRRGTQKELPWKALSKTERETATGILEDYLEQAKSKALLQHKKGTPEYTKFVNDAVLGARLKNGYNYVHTLSRMPLLQFIQSDKPTDQEIISGIKVMRKHIAADLKSTKELLALTNRTHITTTGRSGVATSRKVITEIDPRALGILDFSTQLEKVLEEAPQYCGLATSLIYTKENRKLGNDLAIGVPLAAAAIAVPFFAPWIVGAGVGALVGSVAVVESKLTRDEAAHRFLTVVEYENVQQEKTSDAYAKLAQADKEFKVSLILPPAGAILGGAGKTIEVTRAAIGVGARMSANMIEKSTVAIKEMSESAKRLERGIAEIKSAAKENASKSKGK